MSVDADVETLVSKVDEDGNYHWKVSYNKPNLESMIKSSFELKYALIGEKIKTVKTSGIKEQAAKTNVENSKNRKKIIKPHKLLLADSGVNCTNTCATGGGKYSKSHKESEEALNFSEALCKDTLKQLDSDFKPDHLEDASKILGEPNAGYKGGCSVLITSPKRYFYNSAKIDSNDTQGNIRRVCVCTK